MMPVTNQPTCSVAVKARGFKSLKEFSDLSGFPVSTLQDWYNDSPSKFSVILEGAVLIRIKRECVYVPQ